MPRIYFKKNPQNKPQKQKQKHKPNPFILAVRPLLIICRPMCRNLCVNAPENFQDCEKNYAITIKNILGSIFKMGTEGKLFFIAAPLHLG